jgi:hypothetical protein
LDELLERWAEIPGYPEYQASTEGRIRRIVPPKDGRPLKPWLKHCIGSSGYSQVNLFSSERGKRSKDVHRLVALTFLGPCPDGMEVGHRDNNRQNCAVSNLIYCTPKQNHEHRMACGKAMRGSENRRAVLNEMMVRIIKRLPDSSPGFLASIFGVSPAAIWTVRTGRTWRHV